MKKKMKCQPLKTWIIGPFNDDDHVEDKRQNAWGQELGRRHQHVGGHAAVKNQI